MFCPKWLLTRLRFVVCFVLALFVCHLALAENSETGEDPISESDRDHWAYRPLIRPAIPETKNSQWAENPIDQFVLKELENNGLIPKKQASKLVLIRRVHFGLLGLPPSVEEAKRFESNVRPESYEQLVNRLLASPNFGERWGQHWLDLARFAETDGFEHDKIRKNAWRYRDWVVNALNQGMPYDEFLKRQIAGDLIEWADPIATYFCLSGPDMPDINLQSERKHTLLNEMTAAVGEAILGLQVGCAQCHNHMYDAISQADFYRMRAFFHSSVSVKKNQSVSTLKFDRRAKQTDHLMVRGDFRRAGIELQPAFLRIANVSNSQVTDERPARIQFAEWLVNSENPLTARVIVNRIWHHHFGHGLATTPSDFGVMGDEPTHPELLDWLAIELMESGWQLKHIHRLIVTSATYRQTCLKDENGSESDHGISELYAFFPRRRLEAETIRDSMLDVAGVLVRDMGGPGVRPELPTELKSTLLKNQWNVTGNATDPFRRSIYIFARRNLRYPLFAEFDRPSANCSCDKRSNSTTAPQSLMLLNSEFSLDMAKRFAGRVLGLESETDARIELLFEMAYTRMATENEKMMVKHFLSEQIKLLKQENRPTDKLATPIFQKSHGPAVRVSAFEGAAWVDLCLVVFNSNEFLYVE